VAEEGLRDADVYGDRILMVDIVVNKGFDVEDNDNSPVGVGGYEGKEDLDRVVTLVREGGIGFYVGGVLVGIHDSIVAEHEVCEFPFA